MKRKTKKQRAIKMLKQTAKIRKQLDGQLKLSPGFLRKEIR